MKQYSQTQTSLLQPIHVYTYKYNIMHQSKVSAYNEMRVPRMSFWLETTSQPLACNFAMAFKESRDLYVERE